MSGKNPGEGDSPIEIYAVGRGEACSYVMRTADSSVWYCGTLEGVRSKLAELAEVTAEIRARIHFLTRQEMTEASPVGTSTVPGRQGRVIRAFALNARPLNEDEQLFLKS